MKLCNLSYFLIYVIFGPLIGLACIELFGFLFATSEFGLLYGLSDRHPKGTMWLFRIKFAYIVALELEGDRVLNQQVLFPDIGRVRNVKQGLDGYIYVSTDGAGIFKIVPSTGKSQT